MCLTISHLKRMASRGFSQYFVTSRVNLVGGCHAVGVESSELLPASRLLRCS